MISIKVREREWKKKYIYTTKIQLLYHRRDALTMKESDDKNQKSEEKSEQHIILHI